MESTNIVAETLRDMPKGTKLYSPACGRCEFNEIGSRYEPYVLSVTFRDCENVSKVLRFTRNGHLCDAFEAECFLFPSEKMRDWRKFFKHGDVIVMNNQYMGGVFDKWLNDDYTRFSMSFGVDADNHSYSMDFPFHTENFSKADEKQCDAIIGRAEKIFNGKYNPETLKVEPTKQKDSKRPFKPFEKVLVRCGCKMEWKASLFSHYTEGDENCYHCVDNAYPLCIPYNKRTAHLLGKMIPYEEGGDV